MIKEEPNYSLVTELPGNKVTLEQLQMICCRYQTASKYIQGKRVLEVGCGPGLGLGYLLSKGASSVVGGDINEASLNIAREHYKNRVKLLTFDAHKLPFDDKSFDVVLMFEVIFYLRNPEGCLSEIRRVLSEKGILILCLPNQDLPGFIPSPFSIKYFSVPELFALLNKYFQSVEIFGAFPLTENPAGQKLRLARLMLAKIFNYFPKGKEIKECLKERFMGKNLILENEISDNACGDFTLLNLPVDHRDFEHQLLYVAARIN